MTFTQARERLGNRDSKKVANNTYLMARRTPEGECYIALRLHETDIIEFYEDCTAVYSGGWRTVTTKARINEYLPAGGIYQKAGVWYWSVGAANQCVPRSGNAADLPLFEEGDQIIKLADYRMAVQDLKGFVKGTL